MATVQQIDDENECSQNYRTVLSEAMQLNAGANRIFSYQTKTPMSFIENRLPVCVEAKGKSRYIPKNSERMLDAPGINTSFCTYTIQMDFSFLGKCTKTSYHSISIKI